jgi:hypothetical protein
VTVIGKAFYDIDHSGKNPTRNRRNYDSSLAVWEIQPVKRLVVTAHQHNGATWMSDMAGEAARVAVEPSGSERDTMELDGISDIEGKTVRC